MTILQAIILGAIQGLTELLPISSSAHLFIIPWMLKWDIPESFDVALHFGTLLAIGLFFFKDWIELIKGGYNSLVHKKKSKNGTMFWYIVFATIPGGIIGFLLDHFSDNYKEAFSENPVVIACALIIMGVILYLVDKKSKSETTYEKLSLKQTFIIGISQALAFIPGVSRSGVTMTTGRAMGVDRESAAKFSFMLSAPIVLAATVLKFKDFEFTLEFLIGVLVSFIVGVFVIKFLLEFLKKGSFKLFAVYRVLAGISILLFIIFTM